MAYDQMLAERNEKGAAMVQAAVDALVAQTRGIEAVVGGIGVEIKVEGSDSLDDPRWWSSRARHAVCASRRAGRPRRAGLGLALPGSRAALGEAAGIELVTAERPFHLLGAERPPIPLWTYAEGPSPFPVHRVRRGKRIVATLENRLNEHTTVHWHGVRLPNAMDGVPWLTRPVYPGERFTYEFTPPDAGTFFFHPHCNTVVQLGRGRRARRRG